MSEKLLNETICLKEYILEKEYKEISQLEKTCYQQDKTNLKLELDYRLNMKSNSKIGLKEINEFLYYANDKLVAYLGISSYGGSNIAEINGMTHPQFRRKGLFKRLFNLAMEECQKRSFNKVLLLSDANSKSGTSFIDSVNGEYDFSEYRMKVLNKRTLENTNSLKLRKAGKLDGKEIGRQNAIYFGHSGECEHIPDIEEELNKVIYMIEVEETVIGKINVKYNDGSAFISGFGILPDFRGRGYGKAALQEILRLINENNIYDIELDVECENSNALTLYKACGFEELSVMAYYKYNLKTLF